MYYILSIINILLLHVDPFLAPELLPQSSLQQTLLALPRRVSVVVEAGGLFRGFQDPSYRVSLHFTLQYLNILVLT